MNPAPFISICTVTHKRPGLLQLLEEKIRSQTYPQDKIQWVILDDSPEPHKRYKNIIDQHSPPAIKYIHLPEKLPLGKKRNESHLHCDGEIIVYMDDDDFYPPNRVEHAVEALLNSEKEIAGTSKLPILSVENIDFWISGPHGDNHATPGTFAFKRSFLETHSYVNDDTCGEEKEFLNHFTTPIIQLDPFQTILCIAHDSNTVGKHAMLTKRKNSLNDIDKPTRQDSLSQDQIKVLHLIAAEHRSACTTASITESRFIF